MKVFLLSLLLSTSVYAVEVGVIEDTKSGAEITITFTDESLYLALDKAWIGKNCKSRFIFTQLVKETFVPRICRAELVKFVLDSGYKPVDGLGRIFSK